MKLPDPRRLGAEVDIDPRHLSAGVAETLRHWAADWAALGAEVTFRAELSRRLFNLMEHSQHVPLDRLAVDLRDLATEAEMAHKRGRNAAWAVLWSEQEVA